MIFACQRLFNLISAKICLCNARTINAQISTRIRTVWSCLLAARLKNCASFNFTGFPCGRLTVRTRAVKNRITLFYVTVCMCPVFRMAVNRTDKSRQKKKNKKQKKKKKKKKTRAMEIQPYNEEIVVRRIATSFLIGSSSNMQITRFEFRPDRFTSLWVPKNAVFDLCLSIAFLVWTGSLWDLQIICIGIQSRMSSYIGQIGPLT